MVFTIVDDCAGCKNRESDLKTTASGSVPGPNVAWRPLKKHCPRLREWFGLIRLCRRGCDPSRHDTALGALQEAGYHMKLFLYPRSKVGNPGMSRAKGDPLLYVLVGFAGGPLCCRALRYE